MVEVYPGRFGFQGVHRLLLARLTQLALSLALIACGQARICAAEHGSAALPKGFVYLRDVAPSIVQDMRYATARNFTGEPVPGYDAAECVLQRGAAEALKRAQEKAQSQGYSLKVYDCYRPARAVRAFMAWTRAPDDGRTKGYYPHLAKSKLAPGYIAPQSTHSSGASVDLTLIPSGQPPRTEQGSANKDCTAPAAQRDPDNSIDMGTAFDCFDPKAMTASPQATSEQKKARILLKSILEAAGFKNYAAEWWHFTFAGMKDGRRYDFPIKPH